MSNPIYFAHAQGTTIGSHANFQAVYQGTISNNYQCTHREDRVVVGRKTIRRILDSDLNYQRVLSSEVLNISPGNGEQALASNGSGVRVRRTVQTAEIFQCPGTFTATTFEAVDVKDRDEVELITRRALEIVTSRRSALLTQIFAVVDSDPLTLVAYNELANGAEFTRRYEEQNWIVFNYLAYTCAVAIQSLRNDETLRFPVTNRWRDWSFNPKTLAWYYDPASISLSPPSESDLRPFYYHRPPLRREGPRELNANEIIACVEESVSDFLFLVALSGKRSTPGLPRCARHGLLTFGAVLDLCTLGTLGHFPSTPSPEWYCHSTNADVKPAFSTSVPWRVDLSFRKTGDIRVKLDFGFRLPDSEDLFRLRAAYLCQSLSFIDECDGVKCVVYIDHIGFELKGTFRDDPSTRLVPVFLFVPPLPIDCIGGTYCIRYPLPQSLFYWSFDPAGKTRIPASDWRKFNIPKLKLTTWIGSYWESDKYNFVRDLLASRNYSLDGRQYARDHGHPELIRGDSHDTDRFKGVEGPEPVETPGFHSRPMSPSTLSLLEVVPEALPIVPASAVSFAGWVAKGFLNNFFSREDTIA